MIERFQRRASNCAAAVAFCLVAAAPSSAQQAADSIWSGGTILTMDDKAMRAEAVAVANGRIVAVGRRSDVMKLQGPTTRLVDLQGRTDTPINELGIVGVAVGMAAYGLRPCVARIRRRRHPRAARCRSRSR